MNPTKHSQATIDRMKSNAEAVRKRLARLNEEYLVRQKVRKSEPSKPKSARESFGQAVARIAKENRITI
jgi:hypothetical protein